MSFILAACALGIVYLSAAMEPWKSERPFRLKMAAIALLLASTHWIGW